MTFGSKLFLAAFVVASFSLVIGCGSSGGGNTDAAAAPGAVLTPYGYLTPVGAIGTTGTFVGNLSVSNSQAFAKMLTYANVCSLHWFGGFDWGDYNCKNWVSRGGYMTLQAIAGGSAATMQFAAGSNLDPYYGQTQPVVGFTQQATVYAYNNSQGIQVVGVNAYGGGAGVRFVSSQGNLANTTISGSLFFQDQTTPFATVTLTRTGY